MEHLDSQRRRATTIENGQKMKLLVQEFLEKHSLQDLQTQHGVYASVNKSAQLMALNYDAIETKDNDVLSHDCRGLILSRVDGVFRIINGKLDLNAIIGETHIISQSFRRFFNHGQEAAKINWKDPKLAIFEKIDGTLVNLSINPFTEQWLVSTRSVPEADLLMDNGIFTFRTLFEKACLETTGISFADFSKLLDPYHTYSFELHTELNRIVVKYDGYGITLLGVRNNITHQELFLDDPMLSELVKVVPVVQEYPFTTVECLIDRVASQNANEHEGVIVRDSQFNRVKIKNAQYVLMSKFRDSLSNSERNCMELILLGKEDDVIPMMPQEIVNNLLKIKAGLQKAIPEHDQAYIDILKEANKEDLNNKKVFAISLINVSQHSDGKIWAAPLFQMYDKKCSNMLDFIAKNRKDGTWGSNFLDKLLEMSKHYIGS